MSEISYSEILRLAAPETIMIVAALARIVVQLPVGNQDDFGRPGESRSNGADQRSIERAACPVQILY